MLDHRVYVFMVLYMYNNFFFH